MDWLNDAFLTQWISTHTILIKYTLAGIYGLLRLIATLVPSNTSNRVIPLLMNLFKKEADAK